MANRKELVHIHSNVKDKMPNPSSLQLGEIAVNYNTGNEFLSIKKGGSVVRFSSDQQIVKWMETKEVFPYNISIQNIDLENNSANLVLKFLMETPKYSHFDKVYKHFLIRYNFF
jgi:hypothetical protein